MPPGPLPREGPDGILLRSSVPRARCPAADASGGGDDPVRRQPVLHDGDVDALEAVEVAAVGRVAVARHSDLVAVLEGRATGVTEARAASAARVVRVAVDLQDLGRQLLTRRLGYAPDERVAHRCRLL